MGKKKLIVEVVEARDLESKERDTGTALDTYCVVKCYSSSIVSKDDRRFKTSVVKKTINPVWNESFPVEELMSSREVPRSICLREVEMGTEAPLLTFTINHSRMIGSDEFVGQLSFTQQMLPQENGVSSPAHQRSSSAELRTVAAEAQLVRTSSEVAKPILDKWFDLSKNKVKGDKEKEKGEKDKDKSDKEKDKDKDKGLPCGQIHLRIYVREDESPHPDSPVSLSPTVSRAFTSQGSSTPRGNANGKSDQITIRALSTREREKTFAETVGPEVLEKLTKAERQRQEVLLEFVNTERDYLRDLQILKSVFIDRIRDQKLLSPEELNSLFSNAEDLVPIHTDLLKVLESKQQENPVVDCIGDEILKRIESLKQYSVVCGNQPSVLEKIEKFSAKYKPFKTFLEEAFLLPEVRQLSLMGFMIKPLQRLTRYPLLLKEILKNTAEDHPDNKLLAQALNGVMNVVDFVNEATREAEREMKVKELEDSIEKGEALELASKKRRLIREGPLKLLKTSGGNGSIKKFDWHSFLFDHAVIFVTHSTTKKKEEGPNYKWQLICQCDLADIIIGDTVDNKSMMELVHIGERVLLFIFGTTEERASWVNDIEQAAIEVRKKRARQAIPSAFDIEDVETLMMTVPLYERELHLPYTSHNSLTRSSSFGGGVSPLVGRKASSAAADSGDREKLFFVEKGLRKKAEDFMSSLRQLVLDLKVKKKSLEEDLATAKNLTQAAEVAQRDTTSHIESIQSNLDNIIAMKNELEKQLENTTEFLKKEKMGKTELEKKLEELSEKLEILEKEKEKQKKLEKEKEAEILRNSNSSIHNKTTPKTPLQQSTSSDKSPVLTSSKILTSAKKRPSSAPSSTKKTATPKSSPLAPKKPPTNSKSTATPNKTTNKTTTPPSTTKKPPQSKLSTTTTRTDSPTPAKKQTPKTPNTSNTSKTSTTRNATPTRSTPLTTSTENGTEKPKPTPQTKTTTKTTKTKTKPKTSTTQQTTTDKKPTDKKPTLKPAIPKTPVKKGTNKTEPTKK